MTTQHGEITVGAPVEEVRRILLTPLELADWNPAFTSTSGPAVPEVGTTYSIRVRPGLNGTLQYAAIGPERIDIDWQVPGLHEKGTWTLHPSGDATIVRHSFSHAGPLSVALHRAFQGVADLRLSRLADRVSQA